MDHARSRVHGDVLSQHAEDFAVEEGMLEIQVLHLAAGKVGEFAWI